MAYFLFRHNITVEESPYRLEDDQVTLIKEVNMLEQNAHTLYISSFYYIQDTVHTVKEENVKEYDPKWYFV